MSEQCPCGSNVSYNSCCEPFHKGTSQPATAEILMKARYSAFVKDNVSFIMDTHDPKTREKQDENEIKQWAKNSEWINLEIKNVEKGGVDDDQGTVEFVANYIINRKNCTHHELSTFKKIDNTWYFNEGEILQSSIKREGPKVGRNDPCPCGSGKKYKKCCL